LSILRSNVAVLEVDSETSVDVIVIFHEQAENGVCAIDNGKIIATRSDTSGIIVRIVSQFVVVECIRLDNGADGLRNVDDGLRSDECLHNNTVLNGMSGAGLSHTSDGEPVLVSPGIGERRWLIRARANVH
jgi:hypothetical protein